MSLLQLNKLLQIQDTCLGGLILVKLPTFGYFLLNIFTQSLSSFFWTSQASLVSRAWLKSSLFLRPRPPMNLGLQIESQFFKMQQLESFSFEPHQNFIFKATSFFAVSFRSLREDITYNGMAEVIVWIRKVLVAYESILTFQLWYFFSTLSTTSWNVPFFDFPINIGSPKYFPFDPSIFKPMLQASKCLECQLVRFLLKTMVDLWVFIFCLD